MIWGLAPSESEEEEEKKDLGTEETRLQLEQNLKDVQKDWQERMKDWKHRDEYRAPIGDKDNGWICINKIKRGITSEKVMKKLKTASRNEVLAIWGLPPYLKLTNEVSLAFVKVLLTSRTVSAIVRPIWLPYDRIGYCVTD